MRRLVLVGLALAWLTPRAALADPMPTERVRYDAHKVVRVWPTDAAELEQVLSIADDVWTERIGVGPLDIRVSPPALAALDATGIDYELRISDVQLAIDEEHDRLTAPLDPAAAPGAWFSDFKDVSAINTYLDTLASDVPERVSVENVGTSLDGRPIRALKITAGNADGKSAIVFTGTLHAREWLSPMTVMCIADTLARDYGSDPQITSVLDGVEVYIIPVVNPDGYAYSWSGDRYWRKNTRGGYGVDLNRNFGYQWGGEGASGSTGDETFRGASAFSEPESQAVNAYVQTKANAVASIDFHSFAELVLYPWGYQYGGAPDEAELSQLAGAMSSAIQGTHGNYFQPIQGSDLYPASGVVDDWSYGELGMMAFTIELRGSDFVTSPSNIIPSCEENLQAALVVGEYALQFSNPTPGGDDDGGGSDGGSGGPGNDHGDDASDDAGDDPGSDANGGDGDAGDDDDDAAGTAGDDGDGEGDDDDDGGLPGALPAGYGLGQLDPSCACSSGTPPSPLTFGSFALFGLLLRRRRAPRGTGQGT